MIRARSQRAAAGAVSGAWGERQEMLGKSPGEAAPPQSPITALPSCLQESFPIPFSFSLFLPLLFIVFFLSLKVT